MQFAMMVAIVGYWIFFLQVEGKEGTPFDAVGVMQSGCLMTLLTCGTTVQEMVL